MEANDFTKEEVQSIIYKLKWNLEMKINTIFLPLQKAMAIAENEGNIKRYVELENEIAPIRKEVADDYDQLIQVRNRYRELFQK